jgi:hypothetical protein
MLKNLYGLEVQTVHWQHRNVIPQSRSDRSEWSQIWQLLLSRWS